MPISKVPPLEIRSPHGITDFVYRSRQWNGVVAYHVTQHLAGRSWQNLSTNQATVAVILEQVDGYCEPRRRVNNPTPRNRYDAGHTMFIPPNVEVWGYAENSTSAVRDLRMRFDYSVIEHLLAEESDPKKWNEPLFLLYDDRITRCAELLAKECGADRESPSLYGESLVTALLAALFTSPHTQVKAVQSGLARWQLRRVVEYMKANLLNDLRLNEVARVTGLSPSHFARAFKASIGLPPHRWLVEQRIHRAKWLMTKDRKPISVAANLAGFATQSHFTKAFRRVTGTTPRHWLRNAG